MLEIRKREIRKIANSVREKCKVSGYGIRDLFNECERLGYKLIRYPLGENAELGFATKKDKDKIIFTNSSSRLSREIFTLAHEIGHCMLHLEDGSSFIDDNGTISGKTTDEKEQEANYFAAHFLMPEDEISRYLDLEINYDTGEDLSVLDIARIMSEFSVSFDMILNHLENIGKIITNEHVRLDNEKNSRRVGNLLKSVGGNYNLNIASKVVSIPYEYIEYAIYNYNHNVIPKETLEEVLKCYNLTVEDISDKLVEHVEDELDELDDLIGGLPD